MSSKKEVGHGTSMLSRRGELRHAVRRIGGQRRKAVEEMLRGLERQERSRKSSPNTRDTADTGGVP